MSLTSDTSPLRVVDAGSPPELELPAATAIAPPIIAVTDDPGRLTSDHWLRCAAVTITEFDTDDRRCVRVDSVEDTLSSIAARCARNPITAAITTDVLASVNTDGDARPALVTESLAYSALQAGPEFARWLCERGPSRPAISDEEPLTYVRDSDDLFITFNRPQRHNAFNDAMRVGLLEALTVAHLDPAVRLVELRGSGQSFCSEGDLAEFGQFDDPASAHIARTRHSPALALNALRLRMDTHLRARVHGQVLGSGLEMAAFCGHIVAHPDARFGLPELGIGLIPGAGGTYSVTRRIGRWRSAYLVLSGVTLDAEAALRWGLVDEVAPMPAADAGQGTSTSS